VVEGGRVVERGTHDELRAADGRYAALHRRQVAPGNGDGDPAGVACLVPGCDDVHLHPAAEFRRHPDVEMSNANHLRARRTR
jgi:hypothetical protein